MAFNASCSVPGDDCSETGRIRAGLCRRHYIRQWRHGDPLGGRQLAIEFVHQAVASSTDECIIWPYSKNKGYGQVMQNRRPIGAHRLVLILHSGQPSDPKMEAAHAPGICHNRACVNPRHLRWATHAENMADTIIDDTARHGERAHNAKLTEDDIRFIRNSTLPGPELGAMFGVEQSGIARIRRRETWTRVE